MGHKTIILFQLFATVSLGGWIYLHLYQYLPAFWLVFWTLLIGFWPSLALVKVASENTLAYLVITNAAVITSICYIGLIPYNKPEIFLLPIMISLLGNRPTHVIFAILLSLSGFLILDESSPADKLVSMFIFLLLLAMILFIRVHVFTASSKRIRMIEGIKALSLSVEARDEYTDGHSKRVARYTRILAKELNKREFSQEEAELCGYVHDIGKIKTPDHILNKEGSLSREEYEIIKQHPEDGYQYLKTLGFSQLLLDGVRYHHERWDGRGYPFGLKGPEIPLIARVIAVADTFDAITTKRTYKQSKTAEYAREEINRCSGSQFDPEIVAVFNRCFPQLLHAYHKHTEYEKQKLSSITNSFFKSLGQK